ncbi:MAG: YlxR family protein [Firmicutes bacterium]|nr:YlxR family protein [Bacillota bacterium]
MKPRRIPQRTCVGCRTVRPKRELIRVVRRPTGEIEVDFTGKVPGRGAYICPDVECLRAAVKGRRLDRALERTVDDDTLRILEEHLTARA